MKLLRLLLPVASLGLVFASCTKTDTVDVPVYVHDTTHEVKHDTTRGPTLMRFISMLPDGHPIFLKQTNDASAPTFLSVTAGSTPQYIIVPDSGIIYYLFLSSGVSYASVQVPVLAPNSIWTCALFKDSSRSSFGFTNDSAKIHPPPIGKCYIRFVNGMAQLPPNNPQLFLDIDGQSPFLESGQPVPVIYGNINDYTLIPAGTHTVTVLADQKQVNSLMQNFEDGAYYTIRVYGDSVAQVRVDQD